MTFHLMFRNLSGLHCCLFVKVLLLLSSNLFILAQVVCFVNNFFELFASSFWFLVELSFVQSPLVFYQTLLCLSIPFWRFFILFSNRCTLCQAYVLLTIYHSSTSLLQATLVSYQTFHRLSTPFFKKFRFFSAVLSPTQITLRFQSPSLKHRLSLFPPVCRALVYNTKSRCICQQLFTKILFFYNLLHFIVFIVF